MELVINDDNLQLNEVQEFSSKVRAILVDDNSQILIANYGNVILLPGGKIDSGETQSMAICRELKEETGCDYADEELESFISLDYYQKDYPKRDGTIQNRLVQTHYFVGQYKSVKKDVQSLTEKEQKGNFKLELIPLENLESIILKNINDNPRNIYFQKEMLIILEKYKEYTKNTIVKKL